MKKEFACNGTVRSSVESSDEDSPGPNKATDFGEVLQLSGDQRNKVNSSTDRASATATKLFPTRVRRTDFHSRPVNILAAMSWLASEDRVHLCYSFDSKHTFVSHGYYCCAGHICCWYSRASPFSLRISLTRHLPARASEATVISSIFRPVVQNAP
jgi:hypothetical protein